MTIQHFLIHQLAVKAGSDAVDVRLQTATRAPGMLEAAWLEALSKNYSEKADKRFGSLIDADKSDSFAHALKAATADGGDVKALSEALVKALAENLTGGKLSLSAYAIVARYQQGMTDYLMLAFAADTLGFAVDEALLLEEARYLDFSRLQLAVRINLSEWLRNASANKYVSCVQARGAARLGEAVLDFIGFEESARSVEETAQLVRAFEAYCDSREDPAEAQELKQKAYDYCTEQLKTGAPVHLGDLSSYLDQDRPDAFVSFARDSEYKLPEEMPLEKRGLRKLVKFSAQTAELSISFSASLFGNSINYDANTDTLTITNLPPALRSQLLKNK